MKKTWKHLLAECRIEKLEPSQNEIYELSTLAQRNLADASLSGLSSEGKFDFAYNAARCFATIAIRASGYRVKSTSGHHWTTFTALEIAMGENGKRFAVYFDQCRQKRNISLYDTADAVTTIEANEILKEVKEFSKTLRRWLVEKKFKM